MYNDVILWGLGSDWLIKKKESVTQLEKTVGCTNPLNQGYADFSGPWAAIRGALLPETIMEYQKYMV